MPILESRRIELTASHTAAGNPDRFSTGTIVIRSDATPTKVRLSPIQRRLVGTLAWPLSPALRVQVKDSGLLDYVRARWEASAYSACPSIEQSRCRVQHVLPRGGDCRSSLW